MIELEFLKEDYQMKSESALQTKNQMDRRAFITKSVGCTAGLTFLASLGIMTRVLAAKEDEPKKEPVEELEKKVEKFLPLYRSCAIASFAALNEQFNLKADNAIPALMPFTGGIALREETCGAVSGCMLAMGFFFEPSNPQEKEKIGSSLKYAGMFFNQFEKEFGSTRCKEIQKHQYGRSYDFLNPEEQKLFAEVSQKSGKCMEVVKKAVLMAANLMFEHS